MRKILLYLMCAGSLAADAQGWTYSTEFGTDFWSNNVDRQVEVVNCNTGSREMKAIGICMRQDVANGMSDPVVISEYKPKTDGLYNKVARGVAARHQRQSSGSSSNLKASSAQEARRTGKNYNYNTSQQHLNWLNEKRAREAAAKEREQERRRQEAIRKKIEDDNRAAAVTAATNARLQVETDRRIQRDYYNANEGAMLAQQRARAAHRTVGPQFQKQKTSGIQRAKTLKGQNKPRRVMHTVYQQRNVQRKAPAPVQRQMLPQEKAAMLKRALMVRAEVRRQNKTKQAYAEYKGIKLSDGVVSTLGRDWNSDDLKTGPLAPPPVSRVPEQKEEDLHKLMIQEFIGAEPVNVNKWYTQEELDELLPSV